MSALLGFIPPRDSELVRMLRAAKHARSYPGSAARVSRGCDELLKVAERLDDILGRETSSRTSFASFVDHYLRLPFI